MTGKTKNLPGRGQLEQLARMAFTSPDITLLERYFNACCAPGDSAHDLTDQERRWITVNMQGNPPWLETWTALEQRHGLQADWKKMALYSGEHAPAWKSGATKTGQSREFQANFVRYAAVLALLSALCYAILLTLSNATLPDNYHLASVEAYEFLRLDTFRNPESRAQLEYDRGLDALLSAHQSWLGLFPQYDTRMANSAYESLAAAFEMSPGSAQREETAFLIAKACLMKGDLNGARSWLEISLEQKETVYRKEAMRILQAVEALQPG